MAKPKYDFNKLTLEMMVDYVLKNNAKDRIDLKQFKTEVDEYKYTQELNPDGTPKLYLDKNNKTKIKRKKYSTGNKTIKYNLFKAKRAFYEEFKDEIEWENPPKPKKEKAKSKIDDILAKLD